MLVAPVKVIGAVICIISCYLSCRAVSLLPPQFSVDMNAWTVKVWCHMLLFCLGFNVRWVKAPGDESSRARPAGIISNHSR